MSSVGFTWREGWRSFRRAGLAGALAVAALVVLAAMIAAAGGVRDSLEQARSRILTRFEVEAFLMPGQERHLAEVAARLSERAGVVAVDTVSKDSAAVRFAEEHGDEVLALLEVNPLPASVIVRYDPMVVTSDLLLAETDSIAADDAIDDVVWDGELLLRFEQVSASVGWGLLIGAAGLVLLAVLLTWQSVRVAARSGRNWARAVFLVGGTLGQIRGVLAVGGLFTGLLGGLIGTGIIGVLQWWLSGSPWIVAPTPITLAAAVLLPTLVGMFGAVWAWPRELASTMA